MYVPVLDSKIVGDVLPITCLPNRLVIRVREEVSVPDDTAPVPDGVTY